MKSQYDMLSESDIQESDHMVSPEPSVQRKNQAKRNSNGSTFKDRVITFGGG